MHERLGVAVTIDNDANVAAWGERVAGAGENADHMLMVTLGTGVGGGLVLDGQLYRGAHGMAGEIGHFVVQLDGEPCQCGQRGCWERYASGTALGRIAREAGFESGEDVVTSRRRATRPRSTCSTRSRVGLPSASPVWPTRSTRA